MNGRSKRERGGDIATAIVAAVIVAWVLFCACLMVAQAAW